MKRCPTCNRTYTDEALNFCLEDGTPLVNAAAPVGDPYATIRYDPHPTTPPPADVYRQQAPLLNQVELSAQPRQWSPLPAMPPKRKSNAVWWILGGIMVLAIIVVGAAIMILALASMNKNKNSNVNIRPANSNTRVNRNANSNANTANLNSNSNLPSTFTDNFTDQNWGTGTFAFGDIWYADGEYHMRAKDKSYLVMYAPNASYNTENATTKVTTRDVEGTAASSGYGLIVHGEKTKGGALEDYAFLIYTGSEPQYQVLKHKAGAQTTVVPWTRSRVIRSGTNPNQIEVRARGSELTFYINGQYIDRITDSENFRRGVAGFYASGTSEVAFDDLQIRR